MSINIILVFIACYLLGSIPSSYILGKLLKGIDIRQFGSGNVGATNALRVLGTKIGIITLCFDMIKGVLAIMLGRLLLFESGNLTLIGCGLAAILGHIFTIFLSFKGGKGVATSAGVFIALIPQAVIISLIVFILTVWLSKYVSLGSILAAIALFVVELIVNIRNSFADLEILLFVLLISIFIVVKHRANIKRILAGNENKISFKKLEKRK